MMRQIHDIQAELEHIDNQLYATRFRMDKLSSGPPGDEFSGVLGLILFVILFAILGSGCVGMIAMSALSIVPSGWLMSSSALIGALVGWYVGRRFLRLSRLNNLGEDESQTYEQLAREERRLSELRSHLDEELSEKRKQIAEDPGRASGALSVSSGKEELRGSLTQREEDEEKED
jgi:hypothetical protein